MHWLELTMIELKNNCCSEDGGWINEVIIKATYRTRTNKLLKRLFSQLLWRERVYKTNGGARDGTTQQAGTEIVMKWHPKKGSFLGCF